MAYPIFKLIYLPALRLMIRSIKGMENLPSNAPFIVVSNHERQIDPFLIIYLILSRLNKKVHFIASPRYWFWVKKYAGIGLDAYHSSILSRHFRRQKN